MFTATPIEGECESVVNTATTEADNEPQTLLVNNSSTVTVEVLCPDVTVLKEADASEVTVGDEVGFTITVDNIGEGTAHGVVLTDQLAAGLTWTEDPDTLCEIDASNLMTCEIGDLAPGDAPFVVHVTATSTGAFCNGIENTAEVSADNQPAGEPPHGNDLALFTVDPQDNNASTAFVEVDCPDIEIIKTVTDGTNEISEAHIDDTITYKYEVTNTGDVDLHDVTVVDDNGTPGDTPPATDDDFTCVIGDLAVGAVDTSCEQDHAVTIADAFASPIINVAVVTGKSPLDFEVTDDDDAEITIIANPHLTITLGCPIIEGVGHIGDEVVFAINVLNDGDVPLINILPTTLRAGTLSPASGLDPDEDITVTFTTNITADEALAGLLTFDVNVSGAFLLSIIDTNGGAECAFTPFVNVAVTKTADDAEVTAPDPIGFEITVTNNGESTAKSVTLNDALPKANS